MHTRCFFHLFHSGSACLKNFLSYSLSIRSASCSTEHSSSSLLSDDAVTSTPSMSYRPSRLVKVRTTSKHNCVRGRSCRSHSVIKSCPSHPILHPQHVLILYHFPQPPTNLLLSTPFSLRYNLFFCKKSSSILKSFSYEVFFNNFSSSKIFCEESFCTRFSGSVATSTHISNLDSDLQICCFQVQMSYTRLFLCH